MIDIYIHIYRTINATNPGSDIAGQVAAAMAAASMVFAPKGK